MPWGGQHGPGTALGLLGSLIAADALPGLFQEPLSRNGLSRNKPLGLIPVFGPQRMFDFPPPVESWPKLCGDAHAE